MDNRAGSLYTPNNPAPALESNPPMSPYAVAPPGAPQRLNLAGPLPRNNTVPPQPDYRTPGNVPPPSGLVPRGAQDS